MISLLRDVRSYKLLERGLSIRVNLHVRICKPTNASVNVSTSGRESDKRLPACHGAEVMIERSVLLHEEDDMFDICQRACRGTGGEEQ